MTGKLHQLIGAYQGAELTEASNMTLGEWLDQWLEKYAATTVRESTLSGYRRYAEQYIGPILGHKRISQITTTDVQRMYIKLKKEGRIHEHPEYGKEFSDTTIRRIHSMLHLAMNVAKKEHLIHKNPTEGATVPKCSQKPKKILTNEQMDIFMKAIEADEPWYDFFYTELTTGLRRGEICGLQWQDFDEEKGTLKIARTLHYQREGEYSTGETRHRMCDPNQRPPVGRAILTQVDRRQKTLPKCLRPYPRGMRRKAGGADSGDESRAGAAQGTGRITRKKRAKIKKKSSESIGIRGLLVGVSGFEPEASWTRTKRDTKLRHTPISQILYLTAGGMSSINIDWKGGEVLTKHGKITLSPFLVLSLCLCAYFGRGKALTAVILSALAHELGHYFYLLLRGREVRHIRFQLFGAAMETPPLSFRDEIFCALSGPAVNLLLFVLLGKNAPMPASVNLCLALYNLLPIFPLDGGRILRSSLHFVLPPKTADLTTDLLWVMTSVLLLLTVFQTRKPLLLIFTGILLLKLSRDAEREG